MPSALRRLVGFAVAGFLACVPQPAYAQATGQAAEYELKAAFLYNFAKFVEWPEDAFVAADGLCVGIVGTDPFGPVLDEMLHDKTVHDRDIVVRRFATVPRDGRCHVLFFAAASERDLKLVSDGVLTVTDDPALLASGAIIAFEMEGNKLRFAINAAAAERARLKISAQLLKLAVRVIKDGD